MFTNAEVQELAKAIAATNATADLLGRAHIRRRLETATGKGVSEGKTDLDNASPKPLAPEKALDYFKRLVPKLGQNPQRFGELHQRQAFTLAVATDDQLLKRVKALIQDRLETGQGIGTAPAEINQLLADAGVTPKNPQYGEAVFRTQVVNAYNQGAQEEMHDPDIADEFPAWVYLTIMDGRERDKHHDLNGKYFPNSVLFTDVRGNEAGDVVNCRCTFRAIHKKEWEKLQAEGARFAV